MEQSSRHHGVSHSNPLPVSDKRHNQSEQSESSQYRTERPGMKSKNKVNHLVT